MRAKYNLYNEKELIDFVLTYLKKNEVINPPVLMKYLSLKRDMAYNFLMRLVKKGIVRKINKTYLLPKNDIQK